MTETSRGPAAPGIRARAVWSWCLYDWANSPYITIVVTFVFSAYFAGAIAPNEAVGTAQWGVMFSLGAIVTALLSPALGAIADKGGRRKPWLAAFTFVIAACSAALWWAYPDPGSTAFVLAAIGLSIVVFEISMGFYNAMLPGLVKPHYLGRVSGWGWALGYLGGLVCLVISVYGFIEATPPPFGLDKASSEHVRIAGPLVALWTVLFCLPLFLFTPDSARGGMPMGAAVRQGLRELLTTLREVRRYREIVKFLVARLLFMEGINTLFAFGGIYATGVFKLSLGEVALFGIVLNVTAAAGAFGFAWMDDKIGSKPTILLGVFAIAALGVPLLLITDVVFFWILGALIGLFFGPVQAAARTLMARMVPPGKETEMFGLFTLSGRAIAFLGPALVAAVTTLSASQRWGMATVIPFILCGGALLVMVKAPRQPQSA
jgi:UMF1 family MFS transporter